MATTRPAANRWQPLYGDEIGPTAAERTRSALLLVTLLIALGVAFAAGIGIVVLALLAAVGASIG